MKTMLSTSQVTPAAFLTLYEDLLRQGLTSSAFTYPKIKWHNGLCHSGESQLPGARIELVDSKSTSMAMGFQVLSVARAAALGASLNECLAVAEKARDHTGVLFTAATLEFLHRGGRIGGGAKFLGTALNLKPILEVRDGRVEAVERVRNINKALDRMLDWLSVEWTNAHPPHCDIRHDPENAQMLLEKARKQF
jgi:DegV family protein with EDD domain